MTTAEEFKDMSKPEPPAGMGPALQALWWAGKGDWGRAHQCVQEHEGEPSCDLVHAYLHRQEGDAGNARYWYRSAGRPVPTMSLPEEWDAIAAEFLSSR